MFLLRLSPAFPFTLLNYALGLTRVRFADYAARGLGMLPGTLLYVYLGKVAGDVASASAGGAARGLADARSGRRPRGDGRGDALRDAARAPRAPRGDGEAASEPAERGDATTSHAAYGSARCPATSTNRALVANVHPPDWTNPTPAGRYNLVVIGAGTAGLVTAAGAAASARGSR